ncbi:MAG: 4Fe-4S binding protein [Bacillota bacterium]|jgi:Fe-S-cluster-containing dehydrogenase component
MSKKLEIVDPESCVGCQLCMFACERMQGYAGLGSARISVRSSGGFENGFIIDICHACIDPPCANNCPTGALIAREGGGVKLNTDLCTGCGNCVQACPYHAVFWNTQQNKPEICIYCGYCTQFCPYEVIKLVDLEIS